MSSRGGIRFWFDRASALLLLTFILFSSCSRELQSPVNPKPSPSQVESRKARTALAHANELRDSRPDVRTQLTAKEIIFVYPNGTKETVPLPSDTMVVAVAPYIETTHTCTIHAPSGCRGEMVETDIRVVAKTQDGKLLADRIFRTMSNGFIELWLPRDQEIKLTLEAKGKRVEGLITTYSSSNTCVTTLKLE